KWLLDAISCADVKPSVTAFPVCGEIKTQCVCRKVWICICNTWLVNSVCFPAVYRFCFKPFYRIRYPGLFKLLGEDRIEIRNEEHKAQRGRQQTTHWFQFSN